LARGPSMSAALSLPEARRRLAAAVGFAARRLWRLPCVEEEDQVVLVLLVEALARMGRLYRPSEGRQAAQALAAAPPQVAALVGKLVPLAARPAVAPVPCGPASAAPAAAAAAAPCGAAPVTPAAVAVACSERTSSPVRRPARDAAASATSCPAGKLEMLDPVEEVTSQGALCERAEGTSRQGLPDTIQAAEALVRTALVGRDVGILGLGYPGGRQEAGQEVVAEVMESLEEHFAAGDEDGFLVCLDLVSKAVGNLLSIEVEPMLSG